LGCLKLSYYEEGAGLEENFSSSLSVLEKRVHRKKNGLDYYPFGMPLVGRNGPAPEGPNRYGFQEQEIDEEWLGGAVSYKYRVEDARLGRFLSVDPLAAKYPFYSSYAFSGNRVIDAVELEGLEPARIISWAYYMIGTPYEFGGKKPSSRFINLLNYPEGKKYWKDVVLPDMRTISDWHPAHRYGKSCLTYKDWSFVVNEVRKVYQEAGYLEEGKSIGIDCSGLVYHCYKADNELLFDVKGSKGLYTGSSGQLEFFKDRAKEGLAYVHKDPNLLSKGDFVYHRGHVMLATGNVRRDEEGNVTHYQTIEAEGTDYGVTMKWRVHKSSRTYAHPFRSTDKLVSFPKDFVGPLPEGGKRVDDVGLQRTKDNLIQTTVETPATN